MTDSLCFARHFVVQAAASITDTVIDALDFASLLEDGVRLCKSDDADPVFKKKKKSCVLDHPAKITKCITGKTSKAYMDLFECCRMQWSSQDLPFISEHK